MDEPRIIKKSRGVNLIYQGYQYCKDKTAPNGKTYWRCTKRPRGSCSARVHTTGDEEHIRVVHSIPHDHEPDIESVAVDKMKSDLSTLSASNPTKKLKEVYRDYVQSEELPADDDFQIPMLSTWRSQMLCLELC